MAKRKGKQSGEEDFPGGSLEELQREEDQEPRDGPADAMTELQPRRDGGAPGADQEPSEQVEIEKNGPVGRWAAWMDLLYRYLYFVGVQVLRAAGHTKRRLRKRFRGVEERMRKRSKTRKKLFRIWLHTTCRELFAPFRELREKYRTFRRDLTNARRYGKGHMVRVFSRLGGYVFRRIWRVFCFFLNYALPVAGLVVLVNTVSLFSSLDWALQVTYNGEDLGYIKSESVFNDAETAMKARIINEAYIRPESVVPKFELAVIPPWTAAEGTFSDTLLKASGLPLISRDDLVQVDELTDKLISASGNEIEEAYGLYIQGRFISAVREGDGLLDFLNGMLERYRTPDMDESTSIQFVKKIELTSLGLYPVSSIQPLENVMERLSGEERGEKRYTVQEGDTPLRIAYKNGITFEQLVAFNPDVETSLFVGDSLLISHSVPYLGVKVTTIEKYEEEIDYHIQQETDPKKDIGYTHIKQSGVDGLDEVTDQVVFIDGVETERMTVSRERLRDPVDEIMVIGGNKPLAFIPKTSSGNVPSGAFGWPTVAGSITTGFLGYYGHTGSDITWSGCYGGAVLASLEGQVVSAGWRGAYGNCVIINHGGGVQTLYAHMSRIDVVPGQQVGKGEQVGAIGRTGNVTGPHLHFEIRINGTPVNAAPYLYG